MSTRGMCAPGGVDRRRRGLTLGLAATAVGGSWLGGQNALGRPRRSRVSLGRPAASSESFDDPWRAVPRILARIRPPKFPGRVFRVTDYGASANGKSDARPAFNKAIAACNASGGGRVVVPPGRYLLVGPIVFRSGVNLHLAKGATMIFGSEPRAYLPLVLVRWEGTRCYNYSPLIYGRGVRNVGITGEGTIDGGADEPHSGWHGLRGRGQGPELGREHLRSMGRGGVPIERRRFGENANLRPQLFHLYGAENLLLEGVTFQGSPFWTVTPAFSRNITARGIRMYGAPEGVRKNDDGFNPDSCQDVLIEEATFEGACDNVGIKAGRDNDAWGGMGSENIVIRRSTFNRGWGALTIGSEVGGGIRNIFMEDNRIGEARYPLYIKSNAFRGGFVENVYVRNTKIGRAEECIRIEANYAEMASSPNASLLRNLDFENVTCESASVVGIRSTGLPSAPITDLVFKGVTIGKTPVATNIRNTRRAVFENVVINGLPVRGGWSGL